MVSQLGACCILPFFDDTLRKNVKTSIVKKLRSGVENYDDDCDGKNVKAKLNLQKHLKICIF